MKHILPKGMPVQCFIPSRDMRHLRTLSGDPQMTGLVTEASPEEAGKFCAAILRGLSPAKRRDAMRVVAREAASQEPTLDVVPISALLPKGVSTEQAARIVNGLALMLLGLGSSSANSSVGSALATAASMAKGVPFASDPVVGERQGEVMLAKAILEAALLGDEEAQEWFKANDLTGALERITASAAHGTTDAMSANISNDEIMRQIYDCYKHEVPLGGDAALAGSLSDFFSDMWDSAKKGIASAVADMGEKEAQRIDSERAESASSNGSPTTVAGLDPQSAVATDGGLLSPEQQLAAANEASAYLNSGNQAVQGQIEAIRSALEEARKQIDQGQGNISDYKKRLKDATLQMARLQWADELLRAPDEVATILSAATPNMASSGTFLTSMLSVLPAAKETGDLGTLKALVYALKSAVAKGDGSADSLYSLISGDPDQLLDGLEGELPPSIASKLRMRRTMMGIASSTNGCDADE